MQGFVRLRSGGTQPVVVAVGAGHFPANRGRIRAHRRNRLWIGLAYPVMNRDVAAFDILLFGKLIDILK